MSEESAGHVVEDCLFADPVATLTVHAPWWPAGQDVVVQRDMDYATRRATENAMVRARAAGRETNVEAEVAAGKMVTLQRMIVSWTLRDAQGNPVPVTAESIDRLKGRNAEYIARVISRHNPDPDDADFLASSAPAPAAGSRATEAPHPPSSTGS